MVSCPVEIDILYSSLISIDRIVLLIPVLAFAVIALSYKWDYGKLDLHFTRSGRGFAGPYDEKTASNTHNGVGTV